MGGFLLPHARMNEFRGLCAPKNTGQSPAVEVHVPLSGAIIHPPLKLLAHTGVHPLDGPNPPCKL
jgi:hypothetical protein